MLTGATTGKQRAIDLATKVAIINALETGIETKSKVARRYELPRSTLSTILKNKEKFKHLFATSKLKPGIKRCRLATYQDVEEALFNRFKQARCMNVPISGPIMKIRAKELALKMGHSEFQCSTGLLERFKQLFCQCYCSFFVYCKYHSLKTVLIIFIGFAKFAQSP